MINTQVLIRPAVTTDQTRIANLIYFESKVHRHLDWRTPLDWIGAPEYWLLEQNGIPSAALACPPDPKTIAWLRLFAVASSLPASTAWDILWGTAQSVMQGRGLTVAAIAVHDWLQELLSTSGFIERQQVVVLAQNNLPYRLKPNRLDLVIRPMTQADLPEVAALDAASFEPIWQNSLTSLRFALGMSEISTVGLLNNQIVAYQLSTRNPFGAHLARLAVQPGLQGHGLGYLLVQDLLQNLHQAGFSRLTVNTQNNNSASLALYEKIGFRRTGEHYTVFTRTL
jgi:ribosomal protein S18 acetylase RimI-like enzyme